MSEDSLTTTTTTQHCSALLGGSKRRGWLVVTMEKQQATGKAGWLRCAYDGNTLPQPHTANSGFLHPQQYGTRTFCVHRKALLCCFDGPHAPLNTLCLCCAVLCRWCVRCICPSQACGCQSTPLSTGTYSWTSASPLNAADKQQQQEEQQQQQQQPVRPLAAADTPRQQQQQCQGCSSSLSPLLVQLQGIPPQGLTRCRPQGLAA